LFRLEDVKKSIWLKFHGFRIDPKCIPTLQRSLIEHPGAIFLPANSLDGYFSIFPHLPVPEKVDILRGLSPIARAGPATALRISGA
jgi:hypothetical protein